MRCYMIDDKEKIVEGLAIHMLKENIDINIITVTVVLFELCQN